MDSKHSARRRFLRDSAALAGLSLGAPQLMNAQASAPAGDGQTRDLHAYGERSHFEKVARSGSNGMFGHDKVAPGEPRDMGYRSPLQEQMGPITPASLHYMISHGYDSPDIDPREHRLMIHGLVDRPMMFTMEELKRLPSVSRVHFVECRANGFPSRWDRALPKSTPQATHGLASCSVWTGVPLRLLLENAGVKKGATWIIAESGTVDYHSKSIPLEKAMDDVLLAYGQNGEAIRPEQGYPLRLLVPGFQGINNVKWLRRIKLVDEPYMFKKEVTDYSEPRPDGKSRWFNMQMGTVSVITRPSGGQQLPGRGFYQINGLAWSGAGAIRRVEVSTDGGKTWKDAQLQQPVHSKAFAWFGLDWTWNGEETLLKSRATADNGEVQPSVEEFARIWKVPTEFITSKKNLVGNFCAIQSWKVTRDGSVENAIFA